MVWFLTHKFEQNRYPTWRSTVYVLCITHWTTASSSPLLQTVNKYLQWICTSLSVNIITCHRHSHTCTESLSISQHRKQSIRLGSALMVKLFSSQPACTFPNRQQNASDNTIQGRHINGLSARSPWLSTKVKSAALLWWRGGLRCYPKKDTRHQEGCMVKEQPWLQGWTCRLHMAHKAQTLRCWCFPLLSTIPECLLGVSGLCWVEQCHSLLLWVLGQITWNWVLEN